GAARRRACARLEPADTRADARGARSAGPGERRTGTVSVRAAGAGIRRDGRRAGRVIDPLDFMACAGGVVGLGPGRFDPEDFGVRGWRWVPVVAAVGLALLLAPEAMGFSSYGAQRLRAAGAVLLGVVVVQIVRAAGDRR